MSVVATATQRTTRLDFELLRRGFLYFAIANVVLAPFMADPLVYAGGGFVPFVLLTIIGLPTMPKGLVFFLLWQWAQVFARAQWHRHQVARYEVKPRRDPVGVGLVQRYRHQNIDNPRIHCSGLADSTRLRKSEGSGATLPL